MDISFGVSTFSLCIIFVICSHHRWFFRSISSTFNFIYLLHFCWRNLELFGGTCSSLAKCEISDWRSHLSYLPARWISFLTKHRATYRVEISFARLQKNREDSSRKSFFQIFRSYSQSSITHNSYRHPFTICLVHIYEFPIKYRRTCWLN